MSNFLAVATVTATLRRMLQTAVGLDVEDVEVTTTRPDAAGNGAGVPRVNLYLYQVSLNGAYRNIDLPMRDSSGNLSQRPKVGLDLHYLFTFSGDEGTLIPQRLLGSVVRVLHAQPVLTRQTIGSTVIANPFLGGSNLADAIELVKFSPVALSLEELSKLWAVFFQTPYNLSIVYQGTMVLIESEQKPQASLPVLKRFIEVYPFKQPVIENLLSQQKTGDPILPNQPILAGYNLVIAGYNLRGADKTLIRIAGVEATGIVDVSDTQIIVSIPASLKAGVQAVQVVHQSLKGSPPAPYRVAESNVAAFVLRPQIVPPVVPSNVQVTGPNLRSANLLITIQPNVEAKQHLVLLINEFNPPSTRTAFAYRFEFSGTGPASPPASPPGSVTLPLTGIAPATYLVRVQVDGAESPLGVDAQNRFDSPTVTIP